MCVVKRFPRGRISVGNVAQVCLNSAHLLTRARSGCLHHNSQLSRRPPKPFPSRHNLPQWFRNLRPNHNHYRRRRNQS